MLLNWRYVILHYMVMINSFTIIIKWLSYKLNCCIYEYVQDYFLVQIWNDDSTRCKQNVARHFNFRIVLLLHILGARDLKFNTVNSISQHSAALVLTVIQIISFSWNLNYLAQRRTGFCLSLALLSDTLQIVASVHLY